MSAATTATLPSRNLKALRTDTAIVALKHLQIARNHYADWEAQRDYARSKGLKPMFCPHGANQYTDADIYCGYCEEEGQDWNYLLELERAIAEAKVLERRVVKRQQIFADAVQAGTDSLPVGELFDWITSAWAGWLTYEVRGYGVKK